MKKTESQDKSYKQLNAYNKVMKEIGFDHNIARIRSKAFFVLGLLCFCFFLLGCTQQEVKIVTQPKFIPHTWALSTAVGSVAVVDTWYAIDFNSDLSEVDYFHFQDANTLVVDYNGDYVITFGAGFLDSSPVPDSIVAMRITKNGTELIGSYVERHITRTSEDIWIEHSTYVEGLVVGDKLTMQYIGSDTDITTKSTGTYASMPFNASGYIERIHN